MLNMQRNTEKVIGDVKMTQESFRLQWKHLRKRQVIGKRDKDDKGHKGKNVE